MLLKKEESEHKKRAEQTHYPQKYTVKKQTKSRQKQPISTRKIEKRGAERGEKSKYMTCRMDRK